jgi:ABC-2 type transport system permease protein
VLNIARRELERNWPFLLAVMLILGVFEYFICAMVASIDVEGARKQVVQFAPPMMRAMIEQNVPSGSPATVLAFGWNHPVVHALLAALAITLAVRAVAGEVESGVIELIISQPVSRAQYLSAHALFAAIAVSVALAAGLLGTLIGQHVHSLNVFSLPRLGLLFLNAFLLQAAIYSLTLVASSLGREASRVAGLGTLIALLSYVVNALATLWTKAAFAKPYSLHGHFDPREILVNGRLAPISVGILVTVVVISTAIAYTVFKRRDLP